MMLAIQNTDINDLWKPNQEIKEFMGNIHDIKRIYNQYKEINEHEEFPYREVYGDPYIEIKRKYNVLRIQFYIDNSNYREIANFYLELNKIAIIYGITLKTLWQYEECIILIDLDDMEETEATEDILTVFEQLLDPNIKTLNNQL